MIIVPNLPQTYGLWFPGLLTEFIADMKHSVRGERVVPRLGEALGVDVFGNVTQAVEDVKGVKSQVKAAL